MALRVVAFDTVTGDRIARVPGQFTWDSETNEYGSVTVRSQWSREAQRLRTWDRCVPDRTILAVLDGDEALGPAGVITDRDEDAKAFTLNAAGSIWAFLEHRLVLNPALQTSFVDGEVLIDEDNPAPEWFSAFTGSYVDIAADLVDLALAWGALPIVTPAREGGTRVRTYNGWELLTVASRLKLLTGVLDGPELRFRPEIRDDGGIRFTLEGAPELISKVHRWNTTLPGTRAYLVRAPEDSSTVSTDAWAFGGRSDDVVLAARSTSSVLTDAGWPVKQVALASQSSVSELGTLKGATDERVRRGELGPQILEFKVHRSHRPKPGDWANAKVRHRGYGEIELPVKILQVSGDAGEWLTVRGRRRYGL